MESSCELEYEVNICFMENHEDKEVTSYFNYNELFCICNSLNKESSKLKHLISTSKATISSIEIKDKNVS